jgi:3-hydroxybutyrate dehydrogenase
MEGAAPVARAQALSADLNRGLATPRSASRAHAYGRCTGAAQQPDINHLIREVSGLGRETTGGSEEDVLLAALLHEVVEDTTRGSGLLAALFGSEVAQVVAELCDDVTLPKDERRRARTEAGQQKSPRSRMAKAETGAETGFHGADMSKPAEIAGPVTATGARFGRVDIVVPNASIQTVAPIEDFPSEQHDMIIVIDMSAAWHLARRTFRCMKARGRGRIVNIASAHGLGASPHKSACIVAKHGIVGLARTMPLEGAELGIAVNSVCPCCMLTPLVERQIIETAAARRIAADQMIRIVLPTARPTEQFVSVKQVEALTAFLCTDAAAQITGTAIPIDGGRTAH